MSESLLVDHVNIVWCCFVTHTPPTVDELQLAALDQINHNGLGLLRLLVPPQQ